MAKKYRTIEVTQKDIDRALKNNSARCVVATAIAGSIEGAKAISIDLQTIRFTADGERFVYLTPPAASGYVVAFDAGDPVHPFSFRLSEDHRVIVRQNKKTPAAKERSRTHAAAKKAAKRVEQLQHTIETVDDPAERAVVEAELVVAERRAEDKEATRLETAERLAGEPYVIPDLSPDPDTGGRKRPAPPQAYRRAVRSYGSRQLRINQGRNTPEERAARGAVTAVYDAYTDGTAVTLPITHS